jgi:hypothetical protein
MKSKKGDVRVITSTKLALALACTLIAGQAAAVPYASMIRFGEPALVGSNLNVDLSYTLNEDADTVTVELYNNTTASVVRTYVFNSPDVETTIGRHTITWDGNDDATNPVVVGPNEFVIRVRVQKFETTNEWTLITSNSSGLYTTTEKATIFDGFSSNDLAISIDPTSDQFGVLFANHSYNAAAPGGAVLFGTDLEPLIGNGGGAGAVKGQHPDAAPGSYGVWRGGFDPIDPNLIWWAGQTGAQRVGVYNATASDPNDIQTVADNAWNTTLFPRSIAVWNEAGTRVGYLALGNQIDRATMDAAYPHTITATEQLTAATIGGATRYAQDVMLDAAGNLYFLSRAASSTIWRWDKADVDAAPGVLLDETNAAWHVQFPAGAQQAGGLHIDSVTGNVYTLNTGGPPRGVWLVGNVADASLPATPYELPAGNLIIDFDNATLFPSGFSTSALGIGLHTDLYGNIYFTARSREEIYSFSPPNDDVQHDITTQSPNTLVDRLLLITLEDFSAVSAGPGAPVTVRWTTGSEIDNTGFHLDRVNLGTGDNTGRVNAFLIPAAGENGLGADYVIEDAPLADGENRGYVLVDIDANGNETTHGPIPVLSNSTDPSAVPTWSLY